MAPSALAAAIPVGFRQSTRVAAARRCAIEVGRAPCATIHIGAAVEGQRAEHPRDRARGRDRLADRHLRRAGRPEHDAAARLTSTAEIASRPSQRAPDSSTSWRSRSSERRPSGARASAARRTSAPPGSVKRKPATASGAATAPPATSPSSKAWGSFRASAGPDCAAAGSASSAPSRASGSSPATSAAATIEPADVPDIAAACARIEARGVHEPRRGPRTSMPRRGFPRRRGRACPVHRTFPRPRSWRPSPLSCLS